MSGKLALILGVSGTAAAALAFALSRSPERHPLHKAQFLTAALEEKARHTFKVSGPLSVRVENDGPAPQAVGDVYKVVGIVSSSEPVSDVDVDWVVPRNAEIVTGQLRQSMDLLANQDQRIELTLKAKSPGAQRVRLRATARKGTTRFSASGRYTNKPATADFSIKNDIMNPPPAEGIDKEQKIFQ